MQPKKMDTATGSGLMEEFELMKLAKYRVYMQNIDKALKNFEYSSEWADLISALGKLNKVSDENRHDKAIKPAVLGGLRKMSSQHQRKKSCVRNFPFFSHPPTQFLNISDIKFANFYNQHVRSDFHFLRLRCDSYYCVFSDFHQPLYPPACLTGILMKM